jgi:hypothetical protein
MKNRLLQITGFGLFVFGLANLFRYVPISLTLINLPFPFDHLQNVDSTRNGISTQIGYLPINEATNDPYWIVWSMILYVGIGVIMFDIWRKRK